jgi:kinesin family protein 5
MAFLERNLEQLTVVQRQLVEQNSSLKKEVAIAERKLIARNERIQSLEHLLQDSQEKLTQANHRLVLMRRKPKRFHCSFTNSINSFEGQLTAVKERLEAAKAGSTRGLGSPTTGSFAFGGGSRIAKPLRGGGGEVTVGAIPTLSNLQQQDMSNGAQGKRSSWFFNQRA